MGDTALKEFAPERVATVALHGELDLSMRSQLRERFEEASQRAVDVIVDLTGVTYMDSSAISALIALHRELFERNGTLQLHMKRNAAYRLVEIAGLTDVFDIRLFR